MLFYIRNSLAKNYDYQYTDKNRYKLLKFKMFLKYIEKVYLCLWW